MLMSMQPETTNMELLTTPLLSIWYNDNTFTFAYLYYSERNVDHTNKPRPLCTSSGSAWGKREECSKNRNLTANFVQIFALS